MATHSSVLSWRIPGTGEPGGLPSMGWHRVGHDWSDLAAAAAWCTSKSCLVFFWGVCVCMFCGSVQFSSVAQSYLTLWDPVNHSMPGLPVHHQLPEFTQTHIHRVGDAIQPSHPLSSPSPPAPNPSQCFVVRTLNMRLILLPYFQVHNTLLFTMESCCKAGLQILFILQEHYTFWTTTSCSPQPLPRAINRVKKQPMD